MKITKRIEMIDGIKKCFYNFDKMSISIYYTLGFDLSIIQIQVADAIDKADVRRAIETQHYYSMEEKMNINKILEKLGANK